MLIALANLALAQTFTSTDVPIDITSQASITSSLDVPDDGSTVVDVDLTVHIQHTFTADLSITLRSPQGATVTVASGNGGSGDDFDGTIFDASAEQNIIEGSAPFAGRFRPVIGLGFLRGLQAGGTWDLIVADGFAGDEGVLLEWSLDLVTESPTAVPTVDFVEGVVEDDLGDVIDERSVYGARPSGIAARVAGLTAELEGDGCSIVDGVAGTYRRNRALRLLGASEGGDDVQGPDIHTMSVGAETASATLAPRGRIEGQLSNGTVMHGYFVRMTPRESLWYGVIADCIVD